MTSERE
jgi:hypothetical protein